MVSLYKSRAEEFLANDLKSLLDSVQIQESVLDSTRGWANFLTEIWVDSADVALTNFETVYGRTADFPKASLNAIEQATARDIANRQAQHITQTTTHWIIDLVNEGLASGKTENEIYRDLLRRIPELTKFRAQVIVENEVLAAVNYGNSIGAERSGVYTIKTWRTRRDDRVRDSHVIMEGESALLSSRYSNGLRFPGDPEGPAREIINCRCFETYE